MGGGSQPAHDGYRPLSNRIFVSYVCFEFLENRVIAYSSVCYILFINILVTCCVGIRGGVSPGAWVFV